MIAVDKVRHLRFEKAAPRDVSFRVRCGNWVGVRVAITKGVMRVNGVICFLFNAVLKFARKR